MRRLILTSLFVLVATFSYSQESNTYKATLKKMINATEMVPVTKTQIDQALTSYKQKNPQIPKEFWDETTIELSEYVIDQYVNLVAPIYQKYLTEADLRDRIAYSETPSGRKFAKSMPAILSESMVALGGLGKKMDEKVIHRMIEKGYLKAEPAKKQ